ncbi:MAG: tyrosine-type recombinase/integrase [Natronomonas sp.]
MQLRDHPDDDGKRVWLLEDEMNQLLDSASDTERRIALSLAGRCGLRTKEVVDVSPEDIVDSPAGKVLRVWEGKGNQYRETPIPDDLAQLVEMYVDMRDEPVNENVIPRSTRTLRKWIESARETMHDETGDRGWRYVSMHDLRRSWGQQLVESDVEAGMVMLWGGWDNWETFREHYLGQYSVNKQQEEREKVSFL